MKHSIDGRDVEMLVQIHEAFSQQVADHPREHKRAEHLLPPDGNHVTVKRNTASFRKREKKGKVRKQHLIAHVCPVHPRKREPVGRIRIRQGNQSGKCVRNATMMAMAFTTSRYLLFTICFILKIRIFGEPYGPIHTFRDGNLSADAAHGHTP